MSSAMDNKLINKYRRSFIYQMLITLIVLVGGGTLLLNCGWDIL